MVENQTDMRQHVSILGILYIVFGALGIIAALVVLAIFGGAAGIMGIAAAQEPDAALAAPIVGVIGLGLFVIVALLSLPGLAVGIGLVKLQSWARIGGVLLSALNLLNFPFGTALGAYGLWVLLNKETEPLFA